MKLFNSIKKHARRLGLGAAAAVALTTVGLVAAGSSTVYAGDWSGNSIIQGGASNCQDFINKVRASSELQHIYADSRFGGLTSNNYDNFAHNCKHGVATRDNKIIVNGKTYATSVGSIGRYKSWQGSNPKTFVINGHTYYGNFDSQAFAAGTSSIPVDVLLNASGELQFAVMTTSCGNPVFFPHPTPTYSCNELNVKHVSGNTYEFSTNASVAHGAVIDHVEYNLGDGPFTRQSPNQVVSHTFTKDATVTVKVFVKLPDGRVVSVGATGDCVKHIKFIPPAATYACTLLTLDQGIVNPSNGAITHVLTATASAKNATIKSYTFSFGDGKFQTVAANGAATAKSAAHVYPVGNYSAKVLVTFETNTGKVVTAGNSGSCVVSVPVTPPAGKLVCVSLEANAGVIDTNGAQTYTLKATANPTHATITSYDFTFGDGQKLNVPSSDVTASAMHKYAAQSAAYVASVTVNGKDMSGKAISATSDACRATFKVKTPECKPGVPVGSPYCSTLSCVNLSLVPGAKNNDGSQVYTLNATASSDNATITNYVFSFGDGSQDVSIPSNIKTASTTHSYAASNNNYTARVTVYGKDVANNVIHDTNANCAKPVTNTPQTPGLSITKYVDGKKSEVVKLNTNYEYEVTVTNTGDVTLTNAVVTDVPEDGVVLVSENESLGTITGNQWTYTIPSLAVGQSLTFHFTAQLTKNTTDAVDNKACVSDTSVNNNTPVCDHATVSTTPTPPQVLPAELPNTGAGNIIGIFGASAIVGTIAYRLFLSRKLNRQ